MREVKKTKAELREMLAEAVRNTQPEPVKDAQPEPQPPPNAKQAGSRLTSALHHPAHRRMRPVLDLEPVLRPSSLIGTVAALGDNAL